MSQNSSEENSVKKVFDVLSTCFKNTYEGLLDVLHEEPNYKYFIELSEKQFFEGPNESSSKEETDKSRLCFEEAKRLSALVDEDIDRIIQEKLQAEYLSMKDDVLEAILQLFPSDEDEAETAQGKSKKEKEKAVLAQTENVISNSIENSCDTTNQTSKITNGLPGPSFDIKEENSSDPDLSGLSFGSVSSVHTSDLSSFEDEISLSSDEEPDLRKRRLSLKEAQEKLDKTKKSKGAQDNEAKSSQVEDAQYPVNGNEISIVLEKSHRRRKPNLKYAAYDKSSPNKKKFAGKVSNLSQSLCGDVPRKRGRPRKHST